MTHAATLSLLVLAALLEAGGDALVRRGLQAPTPGMRLTCFALGGLVLLSYGFVVNRPAWAFGRTLGVYVVVFFVVAQLLSWLVFAQPPSRAVLIGGAFLIVGGAIMAA
jgi:drug/metabolite transporter superfamily protein YnfA